MRWLLRVCLNNNNKHVHSQLARCNPSFRFLNVFSAYRLCAGWPENNNNNTTSLACRKPKLQGQVTKCKINYALNDCQNSCAFKCF